MPEIPYERPALKKYQTDAFFHDNRYGLTEGTTKSGKTYTGMTWLGEQALFGEWINYWWLAPTFPVAKIAYTRLKNSVPKRLIKCNETDLTITWRPNGHVMWFKSGDKPDSLYGEDVGAVVIDEGSRFKEPSWHAARSVTTRTRGKIRIIGNVKGRKNWFYKLCRRAEAGEKDMHYAKITAADAVREGVLAQDEIDDAKRVLPIDVFNELYLAIPTEDGSNPFGFTHIAKCAIPNLAAGAPIALGWDFARAIDWTVGVGLNHFGHVSAFDRFQMPYGDEFIDRIVGFGGRAPALVDSTGGSVGDPILGFLQKKKPGRFSGFNFSMQTKQILMEGLAVAIQGGKIKFPEGPIRAELECFEYEYTRTGVRYSAPEGMHDDCVMALALAWHLYWTKSSIRAASRWGASTEPAGAGATPDWQ